MTKAQIKVQARKIAQRTRDAYSADRYASWEALAAALLQRGFTPVGAEAILRSKITRWAADASTSRGRATVHDFTRHLDRNPVDVASVLREEGLATGPSKLSEPSESSKPSIKMRKIDMRITEDEYEALAFVVRYIPSKGKLSTTASAVLGLILLNAKPDGEIV